MYVPTKNKYRIHSEVVSIDLLAEFSKFQSTESLKIFPGIEMTLSTDELTANILRLADGLPRLYELIVKFDHFQEECPDLNIQVHDLHHGRYEITTVRDHSCYWQRYNAEFYRHRVNN